ncbi:MAG: hypothetical protein K9K64_16530 [Desulfohalobiaceae bacterium]|nr:hypothetical protein [Desulfohalobiaceae bacterium]
MKIFLDSAELEEVELAASYGILDGVTTNPSLIKKAVSSRQQRGEDVDLQAYLHKLLETAADVPVSLEVIGTRREEIEKEGIFLFGQFNPIADNVTIKVPVNPALSEDGDNHYAGVEAIKALADRGIPVNCTLVFTPEQALLGAKAGASIVSPFAGRLDDYLREQNKQIFDKKDYFPADGLKQGDVLDDNGLVSGIDLVGQCVDILAEFGLAAEVLAASLRNTRQVREAALAGAQIATLPFEVISRLLVHPKTIEGMQGFTRDVVPEYARLFEEKKEKGSRIQGFE